MSVPTATLPIDIGARLRHHEAAVPEPARALFRGIGQVFFQENALTGILFALGIALSSPLMALGAVIGSGIGLAVARLSRFDARETTAGIYGFNAALVGIATFFFFRPGPGSVVLLLGGCVAATYLTQLLRRFLPFPTYTSPFVLTAWLLWAIGPAIGAEWVAPGPAVSYSVARAVANGISQVMFQAHVGTAVLFVLGIAISEWRHAAWVVAASTLGVLMANYHVTPAQRALDPERLVARFLLENIGLGLYSYNATLPALALFLWRRSLIPALLGVLLSVPLTEIVPRVGLPALTAPFIAATWVVLVLGWFDERFLHPQAAAASRPAAEDPGGPADGAVPHPTESGTRT
jgi:urea transporter